MRHPFYLILLLAALLSCRARGAEPCCPPPAERFLHRIAPAGGWMPYGGRLFHWWPRCCFPRGGMADDYDRKPLPCLCWPTYPPFYTWGTPRCPSP